MLRFIVLLGVLSLFGDMSWRIVCGVKRGEMGCVVDAERADAIALKVCYADRGESHARGGVCRAAGLDDPSSCHRSSARA